MRCMKETTKSIGGSGEMIIAEFSISGYAGLTVSARMEKSAKGNMTEKHSREV